MSPIFSSFITVIVDKACLLILFFDPTQ